MNGAGILAGRIGEMRIMVSQFVPDDTFIVSQRTFDRIKDAFPEARHEIKESAPQLTTPAGAPET